MINLQQLTFRWVIRRDLPFILRIEQDTFTDPWTEEDFLVMLRERPVIGTTIEIEDEIVGFIVYSLHKYKFHLENFGIALECRRLGIGRQALRRMIEKLSQTRRVEITTEIPETNLPAQLFLRDSGFKFQSTIRHQGTNSDSYVMSYNLFSGEEVIP